MAVIFECILKKFKAQADKTGWTYIEIPAAIAAKIKPSSKKTFRVKGKVDSHKIEQASLLPMGNGAFILPVNKTMRDGIRKAIGATVKVQLQEDKKELEIDAELLSCLRDEPDAYARFSKLPPSHQRYYSKWITDARTDQTRADRIARTINGMLNNQTFGETLKSGKL